MTTDVTCYAWSFDGAPASASASNDLTWIGIPGGARLASTDAVNALLRARSPQLTIFRCFGEIDDDGEFGCAEAVALFDGNVSESLDLFARYCAYAIRGAWTPDAVVRQYLATGDEGLRPAAHRNARLTSAELAGPARAAARVAMYAAHPDSRVLAAREAYRLTAQIIGATSLESATRARTQLERALASQLLRGIGSNLKRSLTTSFAVPLAA